MRFFYNFLSWFGAIFSAFYALMILVTNDFDSKIGALFFIFLALFLVPAIRMQIISKMKFYRSFLTPLIAVFLFIMGSYYSQPNEEFYKKQAILKAQMQKENSAKNTEDLQNKIPNQRKVD